jgi:hypothetical protein
MVKNLEILEELKNSAEVKKEGGKIKLVFIRPVQIGENETEREFEFEIPTLEDIEIAFSSADNETNQEIKQMKQIYHLISSQFSPKIAPDDIPKYMKVEEMTAFSEVLEPFLS